MAKFTATHGVQFQDESGVWAHFTLDSASEVLEDGVAQRVYSFETDDAKVADRLRKIDDYGITEVKAAAKKAAPRKAAKADDDGANDA